MATAEQGGDTANTTSSSYGGGGAGGKFRKKLFRRQATPYDRPPTGLRGNSSNTSSWLTKLVVDPASKLISYGADRFFASVFRKRLPPPPPPPPQPPEVNADTSDGVQVAVHRQDVAQEPTNDEHRQLINSSSRNGISELEQLLKQKTFSRSEIVHLTELLQSKAAEVPLGHDIGKIKEGALDLDRHQRFTSGLLEENRNRENRSAAISTPILNSKVVEDDIASPAELAKAFMGSRPSKVSPSTLGVRSLVGREDTGLHSNISLVPKSPIISSTKKNSVSMGAPENGFATPRSRGRSAIYNMARTPYSRVHPNSILKGSLVSSNGYAGSSSSPLSRTAKDGNVYSQPMTLKRRSSALDDEVGSIGPIRRIRQKPNLLASRIHHGVGNGEPSHKASKTVAESENATAPSTSYTRVPPKSTEVAAKILQHLEKMTPKEKSSESRLGIGRDKSPFKLTTSMLSGQALRSMEDVDSSKLLVNDQDDHNLVNRSNATLLDTRISSPLNQGKVEEKGPKESVVPSVALNPIKNNDSAVPLKISWPNIKATDSVINNGVSQLPAFRMTAQEDSDEQDDDVQCNGLASGPFSNNKESTRTLPVDGSLAPVEEPQLTKPGVQPDHKSPVGLNLLRNTSEPSSLASSGTTIGERSNITAFPAPQGTMAALFDKPKEGNDPPPLFSFSSKVADKFPSLPSETTKEEPKLESPSSFLNVSVTGSLVKIPEFDKDGQVNLRKGGDAASNGPPVSSPPLSFTTASFTDAKQPPSGGGVLLTSSTSVPTGTGTSSNTTPATTGNSMFGLMTKPSSSAEPSFSFGASVDHSTSVSVGSAPNISGAADLRTSAGVDQSSGSSSSSLSSVSALAAASSGSSTFGLDSSLSHSTQNSLQGSFFASASKPLHSQDTSVQSISSASLPSFTVNGNASFGSSLSNSEAFSVKNTFGFSSSASSSDTRAVIPAGVTMPSVVKSGASSIPASEATAVISSNGAAPGIFGFGFGSGFGSGSSTASTNPVGSISGTSLPIFGSSGSSVSTAVTNTASSFSSGISGLFSSGGNSSAASSGSTSSSTAPSNAFAPSIFGTSSTGFSFGASSTPSAATNASPSTGFPFGASSTSTPATNASPSVAFPFGASSTSTAATSASPSTGFAFGASSTSSTTSSASPSTGFSFGAATAPTNASASTGFSFGATTNAPQPAGFAFGASSTSSAPSNAAAPPMGFGSSTPNPFSSTGASASVFSSPSMPTSQPVFGSSGFGASPGNNDQMNAEDSMAEDPVQSSTPINVFVQPSVASQPPGFTFGSTVPTPGANPFMFSGQQSQAAPQNPNPFQASGSLGGSFSLGSGGGDKAGRKIVKPNRNKNRRK